MTKLAHKKNKTLTVLVLLLCIFGSWFLLFRNGHASTKLGTKRFFLEIATTPQAHQHGLSDRDYMAKNAGMLFVFDRTGEQCMWMKDMHFNLDMIWIDENQRIVDIKKNLAPDTFPKNFCARAKYVLELTAGAADSARLENGQQLNL